MLSYAFTTLNQGGYEDVATEEFENIHNLFAAILAKGIGKQLKQGLYREYLNRKDDITVVRGKIDMPGTIRNRLSRKQVLTCEYDELSENNLFNQILKTTVMLLLRHARVDQEHKNDLKKKCYSSPMLTPLILLQSAGLQFAFKEITAPTVCLSVCVNSFLTGCC